MEYINISGYKFTELNNLDSIQAELRALCDGLELKGTLLLGQEGINAFASGTREQIDQFRAALDQIIPGVTFKESISNERPFKHMRIKIKPEIVTSGLTGIDPINAPAPYVNAETFDAWLASGQEMIVLDTRNDYEVAMGKFKNALDLPITHFQQFAQAVAALPESFKDKTIVTYCTGGIRCEKAAPYLIQQGFTSVYQLEGGILKYCEKFPEGHFEGACFVFDARTAVGSDLRETTIDDNNQFLTGNC